MTSRSQRVRPSWLLPVLAALLSLLLPSTSSAFIRRDLSPDASFLASETCGNVPVVFTDPYGEESFPKAFKVECGVPMVQVADYETSFWRPSRGYVEQPGTAAWMPATGDTLDYFEKGAGGWQVKDAAERHAVGIAHGFRDLEPAYRQFQKLQEAQAVAYLALPAAAEGLSGYLIEVAWNEAGLPSPKQVWSMGKAGLTLVNPKNWSFATDRLFAGIPIPKFVGGAAKSEQMLFRGVPGNGTQKAILGQQGVAIPRGTALDEGSLIKHVLGEDVDAGVTSWTTVRAVALRFSGPNGTIIEVPLNKVSSQVVPRPSVPKYGTESEVLLRGTVQGTPTRP